MHSGPIYWCEQSDQDLPQDRIWLSPEEVAVLGRLQFPKRRKDWLLGRWTSKSALRAYLELRGEECQLSRFTIQAREDGSPEVRFEGIAKALSLSISHSCGRGLAVIREGLQALGCDIERIESRPASFLETFFTAEEERRVLGLETLQQPLAATLIWSAKESTLKALREGLRRDTRDVEIDLETPPRPQADWQPFSVRAESSAEPFAGWWVSRDQFLYTVVASGTARAPVRLGP